jgi:DNA primase
MAEIAENEIKRLKSEVSLSRLVEGQGYTLQKQGKDYAVCCPFHDDKTPSCIISPKSNLFNCFGCGTGGSVIDWVMKTQV